MSSVARTVPPLLTRYLANLPKHSFLLLTYVLGASCNWLLLRFLHAILKPSDQTQDSTGVILVSFLRNHDFWSDAARKIGLDLSALAAQNKFIGVDGLSELFSGTATGKPAVIGNHVVLRDAALKSIESTVLDLVKRMNVSTGRTVLLVDGLDFVMAANEDSALVVNDMVMEWRQHVHGLVITSSADSSLIHNPQTPLETNHLTHIAGLGHQASTIMSLRLLDTGTAKDVSGVLRVNRGPMAEDDVEEGEFLYFVAGDGGVKVFERGA